MAETKRRAISIRINGKQVEKSFAAISKEARAIRRELNGMTIGSDDYNRKAKELNKVNKVLDQHKQKLKTSKSALDKMKAGMSGLVGLAAGAFALDQIVSFSGELFALGTEMEVLGRKAETVFGEVLPQVTAAAEKNANAMGLTKGQYTDAAAAIGDLLVPMGFQRDESAAISTELVNLSGALSEWSGGQRSATEVTEILSKAVLGEREQLKGLGISITEADVKARMAEKGQAGLTGELLQQAKAAATLELITEKSSDAQAAFAANSDTLVRKQAELRARFQEIKEAMATALIPVFHRLLEASTPVIKSVSDFVINLLNGKKATGKFSGFLNFLVTALQNTAKVVSFVGAIFGKFFNFLLDNGGGAIEFIIVKLLQLQNFSAGLLNRIGDLLNIDIQFKRIDIAEVKASFQEFKKARLESGIDDPIEPKFSTGSTPSSSGNPLTDGGPKTDLAINKITGGTDDKVLERLDKLKAKVVDLREEFETGLLPESDQAIAVIEKRYDEQLTKAIELTRSNNMQIAEEAKAQIVELEKLKGEAIAAEKEKQFQVQLDKDIEYGQKLLKEEQKRFEEKQAFEAELNEFIKAGTLSEQEQALEQLKSYYEELSLVAQDFGIDTTDLLRSYREKETQINEEYNRKNVESRKQALREEAESVATQFASLGKIVQGFQQLAESSGERGAGIAKTLSLVVIAAKTAEAIATGVAASAGVPFPGNLLAIATTVGTVLTNITAAKKILSDAPSIQQRKKGGYLNVRGLSDGRDYQAEYIGKPGSGMLPAHPVVLASEGGAEYFVANEDLKNPQVLNYVRAIENIRTNRGGLPQFKDGGFTESPTPSISNNRNVDRSKDEERLARVLERLADRLDDPIYALIEDLTIAEIKERAEKLSSISGGAI